VLTPSVNDGPVSWFFRVVEQGDDRWACRFGRHVYDTHPRLDQAIEHITTIAAMQRPAELFIHRLGGSVECLGDV
jgi:hypothetical protein